MNILVTIFTTFTSSQSQAKMDFVLFLNKIVLIAGDGLFFILL